MDVHSVKTAERCFGWGPAESHTLTASGVAAQCAASLLLLCAFSLQQAFPAAVVVAVAAPDHLKSHEIERQCFTKLLLGENMLRHSNVDWSPLVSASPLWRRLQKECIDMQSVLSVITL